MTEKDGQNPCSSKFETFLFSYLHCLVTGKLVQGCIIRLCSKSNLSWDSEPKSLFLTVSGSLIKAITSFYRPCLTSIFRPSLPQYTFSSPFIPSQ